MTKKCPKCDGKVAKMDYYQCLGECKDMLDESSLKVKE